MESRTAIVAPLVLLSLILGLFVGFQLSPLPTTVTKTDVSTIVSRQLVYSTTTAFATLTTTSFGYTTLERTLSTFVTTTSFVTRTHTATFTTSALREQVVGLCFSATMDCASMLVSIIDNARSYVHVMVFSFTLDRLGDALIRAKNRGVSVKVVVEKQQANVQGSEYQRLLNAGVEIRIDGNPRFMHHKVMIVDGLIVVTGSYNWSASAEDDNDENVVIISDLSIARVFEREFERVWNRAVHGTQAVTT